MGQTRGGTNLGTAWASVKIDHSQVTAGMDAAMKAVRGGVSAISASLESVGRQVEAVGSGLTRTFTPAAAAFGLATKGAMDFEESLTNIQSVTFKTTEEMNKMRGDILGLAEDSRYGPQQLALAMYDIAGGVQDATTHMAILEASVKTATAGNADLAGTTSGLISVMNAYDLTAADAAKVSDVLVRTVGMGVGTMDQFTAALGPASGLAYDLGISFEELAASTAFLTSTGSSPSEAVTQLTGVMSAFLKPNANMTKALKLMGYESGTAAIEALGLQGAVRTLSGALGGSTDEMAKALGQQEALGGAIGLLSDRSKEFTDDFIEGMDGAAAAAEEIQLTSTAAQFDILTSNVQILVTEIGSALLPVMNDLIQMVKPVIKQIVGWVRENPELVKTIGMIVVALGTLGPILSVVGAAISGIGALIGALASPIVLVVGALGALYVAFQENLFGLRDTLQPILQSIQRFVSDVIDVIRVLVTGDFKGGMFGGASEDSAIVDFWFDVREAIIKVANDIAKVIQRVFGAAAAFMQKTIIPAFENFVSGVGRLVSAALPVITSVFDALVNQIFPAVVDVIQNTVLPIFESFVGFLSNIWNMVVPALENLYNWFVVDALPQIVSLITESLIPAVKSFIDFLGQAWELVRPALEGLARWFLEDALPAIQQFISGTVLPALQQFFGFISGVWEQVKPALLSMLDWFINTGLPAIQNFVENTVAPALEKFFNFLGTVWETIIKPGFDALKTGIENVFNWLKDEAIPAVQPIVEGLFNLLATAWETIIKPGFDLLKTGIEGVFNFLRDSIFTPAGDFINKFIDLLKSIWSVVETPLNDLKNGISGVFEWIKTNVIDPIITRIEEFIQTLQNIKQGVEGLDLNPFDENGIIINPFAKGGILNRDSGGRGYAGQPYAIGAGAQPEIFIPDSAGSFYPRGEGLGGGAAPITIERLSFDIPPDLLNSVPGAAAAGAALADAFEAQLKEKFRSRG